MVNCVLGFGINWNSTRETTCLRLGLSNYHFPARHCSRVRCRRACKERTLDFIRFQFWNFMRGHLSDSANKMGRITSKIIYSQQISSTLLKYNTSSIKTSVSIACHAWFRYISLETSTQRYILYLRPYARQGKYDQTRVHCVLFCQPKTLHMTSSSLSYSLLLLSMLLSLSSFASWSVLLASPSNSSSEIYGLTRDERGPLISYHHSNRSVFFFGGTLLLPFHVIPDQLLKVLVQRDK